MRGLPASRLTLDHRLVQNPCMNIPVSDAKGLLTDLIKRAEQGEEIVLTRHGRAVARLVAIKIFPIGFYAGHPEASEGAEQRREIASAIRRGGERG